MAIMKKLNAILKISGLISTALVLMSISGEAANSCRKMGLSNAQCACQSALSTGSQSALRKFLQAYPGADTACNAMASTAPIKSMIVPERDREGGNAGQNDGGRRSPNF
jgi:hypothetical protein